jgi:hypothetical protein
MLWFTFKVTFETIPGGWLAGWVAGKEMIIILPQVQLELELGLELGNYLKQLHVFKEPFSPLTVSICPFSTSSF